MNLERAKPTRRIRLLTVFGVVAVLLIAAEIRYPGSAANLTRYMVTKLRGGYTEVERVGHFGAAVEARLRRPVESAGLIYPPHELAYVAFKDSRRLEVYGRMSADQAWRFIKDYPVLGASGRLGPKMVEGDNQVPEGVYGAELLNPNSRFHLSIKLDYPSEFDRKAAEIERRTELGSNIMIHGGSASIGCLAMGDEAVEDLFVLATLAGKENVRIVISPVDLRRSPPPVVAGAALWVEELYDTLGRELRAFPIASASP